MKKDQEMIRLLRPLIVVAALSVMAVPPSAYAVDTSNPDWPCVQRKVEKLTSAQIWDGPDVDDVRNWWEDKEATKLARYIITRRVDLGDAEAAIAKFAEAIPEGEERDKRLTTVFAAVLEESNKVRSSIVAGIERFQKRQVGRSQRLEQQSTELSKLRRELGRAASENPEFAKLQEEYDWNARVFKERQDNLPLACEIPVEIEQRAFAVGRALRFHMS